MKFTKAEENFLVKNEIGRLATVSADGTPHVVPVSYVYKSGYILIAVDYDTKKYRNLRSNGRVAFVVDTFRPNRGILVQGIARLYDGGPEFREAYTVFYKKFSWVRANPWGEGEAPFLKIEPSHKASWGL